MFLNILNVKDVNLYVALLASTVFILLITTTAQYSDIEIINIVIYKKYL